jgi:nucleoid-associated protein YgaU
MDSKGVGERQRLSVSMQSLDGSDTYDVPDFQLENDTASAPPTGLYEEKMEETNEIRKKSSPLIPVIIIVAALLIVAALVWLFVFRAPTHTPVVQEAPAVVEAPAPAPVIEAPLPVVVAEPPTPVEALPVAEPARRVRPPAPVTSYKVPQTIPKDGFRYRIRWGDTLWDISEAFYRNPWLYPRIARFNKIRNPDLIISGHFIRVPPKK